MQHRGVPGDRAAGNAFQRPAGPLAGAQQQRLDGFHHDGALHGGEVFRLARGFDARDHIVAKTDLLVERAGPRQHFASDEIHEQHDHRGRAHIHRERRVAPAGLRAEKAADARTEWQFQRFRRLAADVRCANGPECEWSLGRRFGRGRPERWRARRRDCHPLPADLPRNSTSQPRQSPRWPQRVFSGSPCAASTSASERSSPGGMGISRRSPDSSSTWSCVPAAHGPMASVAGSARMIVSSGDMAELHAGFDDLKAFRVPVAPEQIAQQRRIAAQMLEFPAQPVGAACARNPPPLRRRPCRGRDRWPCRASPIARARFRSRNSTSSGSNFFASSAFTASSLSGPGTRRSRFQPGV